MKQEAMDGVESFLPQEIITNILKFVPVKSLIRFQSVSKQWKNLIKSPSFIAAHLHHSTQHRPCLLFHQDLIRNRLQLHLLDCDMQIAQVQNTPVVDGRVWIVGSSNGLLCLRYGNHISHLSLLLWNPALRELRHVPPAIPEYGFSSLGFGSCPIANDYKIVRLYGSKYEDKVHFAEVYSLGTGSWNKIEVGNSGGLILMDDVGFTMNGAIFWLGLKKAIGGEIDGFFLVSFNIATEEFSLISLSTLNISCGDHVRVRVNEFESKLAILCSTSIGNAESCLIELWVLEEGTSGSGERSRWAKKYTSSPYPWLLRPLTIWRNEIACIFHLMPGVEGPQVVERTVLSNFANAELKVLFNHSHFIFNYVESLVPVNNIHVEES